MKDLSIADLYAILNAGINNEKVEKDPDSSVLIKAVQQELQNRLMTLLLEVKLKD